MTTEATAPPAVPGIEPVTLAAIIARAPDGQVPAPGLEVWCDGQRWELVGAGERAATLAPPGGGWEGRVRRRQDLIRVDPAAVTWAPAEPTPKEAFARMQNLDRETKAARAQFIGDVLGGGGSESGRASAGRRPAATVGDQVCSRPDCETVLHPANKTGVCRRCQFICPECGGPKSQTAAACGSCGSKGGRRPGSVSVAERACATCGAPMGIATKAETCLACRRKCACGRPKSEDAERCGVCAPAARRAATAARDALAAPPSRSEMPLGDVVLFPETNTTRTSATVPAAADEGPGGGRRERGAGDVVLGAPRPRRPPRLRRLAAGADRTLGRPRPGAGARARRAEPRGRSAPGARGGAGRCGAARAGGHRRVREAAAWVKRGTTRVPELLGLRRVGHVEATVVGANPAAVVEPPVVDQQHVGELLHGAVLPNQVVRAAAGDGRALDAMSDSLSHRPSPRPASAAASDGPRPGPGGSPCRRPASGTSSASARRPAGTWCGARCRASSPPRRSASASPLSRSLAGVRPRSCGHASTNGPAMRLEMLDIVPATGHNLPVDSRKPAGKALRSSRRATPPEGAMAIVQSDVATPVAAEPRFVPVEIDGRWTIEDRELDERVLHANRWSEQTARELADDLNETPRYRVVWDWTSGVGA